MYISRVGEEVRVFENKDRRRRGEREGDMYNESDETIKLAEKKSGGD